MTKKQLSILLPVYNWDIINLVETLALQAQQLSVPYEIIVRDDFSSPDFRQKNAAIQHLPNVRYILSTKNMGRAAIRNQLAKDAQYDYLLYMDCDVMPISDAYLSNYVQHLHPEKLLYGGRVYKKEPPKEKNLYFHWHYGSQREQSTAAERQQHIYRSFMTNNFLVPRTIFEAIQFDESLKQYGHEDTLFGWELQQRQIPILHIDNPLDHIGLEDVNKFIEKTRKGIENLYLISQNYPIRDIRLLEYFYKVKRWKIAWAVRLFYRLFKGFLLKNLHSERPNLRYFDIYKLGYLLEISRK